MILLKCISSLAAVATAQLWYHIPNEVGPVSDFSPEERKERIVRDPGMERSGIMGVNTYFQQLLKKDGQIPFDQVVMTPEEWSTKVHVNIVNGTPFELYGTQVVTTDRGLQPYTQYDYHAAWNLQERPRKVALLVEDMIVDYAVFVGYLVATIKPLITEFRAKGLPVFWSSYARRPDDGMYNGVDRYYGPTGLKDTMNPMYIYTAHGTTMMDILSPTPEEVSMGRMLKSAHLDKFADLDTNGKSIFAEMLRLLGVDTLVVTGAWTEDCIFGTVSHAVDEENLDVIVIEDGVGSATPAHFPALDVMKASLAKVMTSAEFVSWLQSSEVSGGAVTFVAPEDLTAATEDVGSHPSLASDSKQILFLQPFSALALSFFLVAGAAFLSGAGVMAVCMRKQNTNQPPSYLAMDP